MILTDVPEVCCRRIALAPEHLPRRRSHVDNASVPEAHETPGFPILGEAVDLQPAMLPIRVAFDVVRALHPGRIQGDGIAGLGTDARLALYKGHMGEGAAGGEDAG